jgi:predicted dehydrogenase
MSDGITRRDASKTIAAAPGPQPYNDYRQLLERKDIQAILVATPRYSRTSR